MRRSDFVVSAGAATGAMMIPRRSSAAPVVKIGILDSYTGGLSEIAARHGAGAQFAVDRANRTSSAKFTLVSGDDGGRAIQGAVEAKRLMLEERVAVVVVGTSSAVALAVSAAAAENNTFALTMGSSAASITGAKANRVMFRFPPNNIMSSDILAQRMRTLGKRWFFLVVDTAFGHDNYTRLLARIKGSGGNEVGSDVVQPGIADFTSALTKLRNSSADGLVMCQASADATKVMKQFCEMGLSKTFRLVGVDLEDFAWQLLPCDQLAGALFPVHWAPNVSDSAGKLAREMQPALKERVSWRHYFGYQSVTQIIDRMQSAGTTDTSKLVAAFQEHSFDAAKPNPAVWRACDHQCAQDEWVGTIVSSEKRGKMGTMFDLAGHIAPASGAQECSNPDALSAMKIIQSQKISTRDGYTSLKL